MSSVVAKIVIAAVVAVILGITYAVLFTSSPKPSPAQTIKVLEAQGKGQAAAARDTNKVVVTNTKRASTIDAQTQENRRAISKAPGADAPANDAVDLAGRRAICMRNSARDLPECQRLRVTSP